MSIPSKLCILLGALAFLLAGCSSGGGSGSGKTSAKAPNGEAPPIVADVTSLLDLDTGRIDSIVKNRRNPETDRFSTPGPADFDSNPTFPTAPPTIPTGNPGAISGAAHQGAFGAGTPGVVGKGANNPGEGGQINQRNLPHGLDVGAPTPIPPRIDTPKTVPPVLASGNSETFGNWVIGNPGGGGGGGLPPTEKSPTREVTNPPATQNFPAGVTAGEDRGKGGTGGEEPVPEPSTVVLMIMGMASLYFFRRR